MDGPGLSASHHATQQQQHAPAISAVCVDVRELLRCAAAADAARATEQASQPEAYTVTSSSLRLPSVKQQHGTTYWAPGSETVVDGGAYGGPPPLSPADPTILRAILANPPPTAITDRDAAATRASRNGWSSKRPLPPRLSRGNPTKEADSTFAASSSHIRRGRATTSKKNCYMAAQGDNHAAPPVVATTRRGTRLNEGREMATAAHNGTSALFGPATGAGSEDEMADMSPSTQQIVHNVLTRLHTQAASMLRDGEHHGEAANSSRTAASSAQQLPPQLPVLATKCEYATKTHDPSLQPGPATFVVPTRNGEIEACTHLQPMMDQSSRRNRMLAHSALHGGDGFGSSAATQPLTLLGTQKRRMPLHIQERAAATAGAAAQDAVPPRRTIPAAFRRQLHYTESAPTTRRPKRK